MFLSLLRIQHPLVYRFAWFRIRIVVLRACGLRKKKTGNNTSAATWRGTHLNPAKTHITLFPVPHHQFPEDIKTLLSQRMQRQPSAGVAITSR
ncbi:hypothetical protein CS238_21900 [Salmonella enterica]|nr:hypothetical protein [Salmonella enterica]